MTCSEFVWSFPNISEDYRDKLLKTLANGKVTQGVAILSLPYGNSYCAYPIGNRAEWERMAAEYLAEDEYYEIEYITCRSLSTYDAIPADFSIEL